MKFTCFGSLKYTWKEVCTQFNDISSHVRAADEAPSSSSTSGGPNLSQIFGCFSQLLSHKVHTTISQNIQVKLNLSLPVVCLTLANGACVLWHPSKIKLKQQQPKTSFTLQEQQKTLLYRTL